MEWIAVLVVAGLVCAVGVWLGERDPVVRHYKPGLDGLFRTGRSLLPPEHSKLRDNDSGGGKAQP